MNCSIRHKTIQELIKACKGQFEFLSYDKVYWHAQGTNAKTGTLWYCEGKTAEDALTRLVSYLK